MSDHPVDFTTWLHSQLVREDSLLVDVLKKGRAHLAAQVAGVTCDHDAGMCVCPHLDAIARADQVLKDAEPYL